VAETAGGCACPSAQPDMAGARVFGVLRSGPDGPRTGYLDHAVDATCEESRCSHFDGTDCRLATRIVQLLPPVVAVLPRCAVRNECRWFAQEGRAACLRCPQVVTLMEDAPEAMEQAARPQPIR
jgi:hypothetical protein